MNRAGEVFIVVRHYAWQGDSVESCWLDESAAVRERDRLNKGELPDPADHPSLERFGDQSCLDYQVRVYPLRADRPIVLC